MVEYNIFRENGVRALSRRPVPCGACQASSEGHGWELPSFGSVRFQPALNCRCNTQRLVPYKYVIFANPSFLCTPKTINNKKKCTTPKT